MKENSVNVPFSELSRFEFSSDANHIRYEVDGNQVGHDTLYQLQPGILLRIMDFKENLIEVDAEDKIEQIIYPKEQLVIAFKIKGNHLMKVDNGYDFQLNEGLVAVGYSCRNIKMDEVEGEDEDYLMVMLMCKPEVLFKPPFNLFLEQLPNCLESIFSGEDLFVKTIAMSESVNQALRILLSFDVTNYYSNAFLKAKSVELLCLALDNLSKFESQTELSKIPAKEIEILKKAGVILKEQWREPPEQDELVKILGIGKSRLKKGFKLFFGVSTKEYVTNIRLQQAQQLLLSGHLNVTQVGLEVGYEHTSNFTSAFKNKFGISPKTFQTMSMK